MKFASAKRELRRSGASVASVGASYILLDNVQNVAFDQGVSTIEDITKDTIFISW